MRPLDTMVPVHWHHSRPVTHVLHPGDVSLAYAGDRLETLLGSCVAVLMTDRKRTTAAMCHIVHTNRPSETRALNTTFAGAAMVEMFKRLRSSGLAPELCDTWVFGGGHMFPGRNDVLDVGGRNVKWVDAFLRSQHIRPRGELVGGHQYRKVAWTVGPTPPEQAVAAVDVAAS